jgi:hypothetical protein
MSDLSGECLALNAELPPSRRWHRVAFRAINEATGDALWPGRYPLPVLRDTQREFELAGRSYMFDALYQQNPRADPSACAFPDDYFTGHDGRQLGHLVYDQLPPSLARRCTVVACDPSHGARSKPGDYCAIATLVLDRDGFLWANMALNRYTFSQVCDAFTLAILRDRPDVAIVETQGGQEGVMVDVRRRLDDRLCITTLHAFETQEDKQVRIAWALDEWLRLKRLRLADNLGGRLTIAQLREFPSGEHDDGPDAIAIGLSMIGHLLS